MAQHPVLLIVLVGAVALLAAGAIACALGLLMGWASGDAPDWL